MKKNNNELILSEFKKLIDQIKFEMDSDTSNSKNNAFRLKQVIRVYNIIKKFPQPINSVEQLKNIPGVGKGSLKRIQEIIDTGKLSEIVVNNKEQKYLQYIEDLSQVIGIGHKTAYQLVKKYNITSVDQLIDAYKKGKVKLNEQIILGLKYFYIYKQEIPRAEIDLIYNFIAEEAFKIDNKLLVVVCGSYRRLKATSSDIDILLTHPDVKNKKDINDNNNFLFSLVKHLESIHFLLDSFTDVNFETKYMGFCQLTLSKKKFPVRRIDIWFIPYNSYYSALLALTGSQEFIVKIRTLAIQLGYRLNEYGLFYRHKNSLVQIPINSEKDIFDKLGMEYLAPELR